jgi:hypothetical protein
VVRIFQRKPGQLFRTWGSAQCASSNRSSLPEQIGSKDFGRVQKMSLELRLPGAAGVRPAFEHWLETPQGRPLGILPAHSNPSMPTAGQSLPRSCATSNTSTRLYTESITPQAHGNQGDFLRQPIGILRALAPSDLQAPVLGWLLFLVVRYRDADN